MYQAILLIAPMTRHPNHEASHAFQHENRFPNSPRVDLAHSRSDLLFRNRDLGKARGVFTNGGLAAFDVGAFGEGLSAKERAGQERAMGGAGFGAGQVLEASSELSTQSDNMSHQVEDFLKGLKAI
jgi:hypothetical protein